VRLLGYQNAAFGLPAAAFGLPECGFWATEVRLLGYQDYKNIARNLMYFMTNIRFSKRLKSF